MLNIMVGYPSEEEELDIVRMTTSVLRPLVSKVLSGTDILGLQELVRKVRSPTMFRSMPSGSPAALAGATRMI